MNIKTPKDSFNHYADLYQDKFMDLSQYQGSLDLFCNLIEQPNAVVLDAACGPGNISSYLLKEKPNLQLLGIDLAPKMIELAKNNNPTATFQTWDCRDICQLNKKFEAIICGFGLPYLSKAEAIQFITDCADCLQPGGLFYLSTMEDDYLKSGPKTSSDGNFATLQYYHQADYLMDALSINGLELVQYNRIYRWGWRKYL